MRDIVLSAAAEPSKVPFYIAGAVLAVWGVAVSAVGLTRPSFPVDARGQRAVVAISLVLVGLAVAMALVTDK
jgi:hypothetical protein